MTKKTAPRVGLDSDVATLMQAIAVYHGGNLTAAVNYALRLAAPAILQDLQTYRPLSQPLKTVTISPPDRSLNQFHTTHTEELPVRRSNAERLQGARL